LFRSSKYFSLNKDLRTLKAELKYFIMLLLEKDPMNRLTAKEGLNNVWLK